jgi:hypothetical protein
MDRSALVLVAAAVVSGLALGFDSAGRGSGHAPGVSVSEDDPFANLPLVLPGQLAGRVRYVANPACELRDFDLATGTDVLVTSLGNCVGYPVLAPTGEAVAMLRNDNRVVVGRSDGTRLVLGPSRPHFKPPGNFIFTPLFSADGRKIAYCTYTRTRMRAVIAETSSGKTVATVPGTCEAAFTARGIAYVRGASVVLGGRTIFRASAAAGANTVNRIGPEGNPLIANPRGTLLAFATRPLRHGVLGNTVAIHILGLDGREIATYHARIDITLGFQALAPSGKSAVVWWGDILQLAAFGRGSLTLRYNLGNHGGDGTRTIFPSAYSPDGLFAMMPRRAYTFPGQPAPPPQAALILTADDLVPRYRLAIDAEAAMWVRG